MDYDQMRLYTLGDGWFYEPPDCCRIGDEYLRLVVPLLPPQWALYRQAQWLVARPPDQGISEQGWRIEASARPADAERVLHAAAEVCVQAGRGFKFAADLRLLERSSSKGWSRSHAGRFITVYPRDETEFLELIERLHQKTGGAEGPYILSDRRYRDSAVLFYRYGAMRARARLQVTGEVLPAMISPGGEETVCERTPYWNAPPWVSDPFPSDEEEADGEEPLNGRYVVSEALRFSAVGGVYLCADEKTGGKVVVKEARPHTSPGPDGDAVARAGREFRILGRLRDTGLVPVPLEKFQAWEHTFLVEEFIDCPPSVEPNPLLVPAPTPDLVRSAWERWQRIWMQLIQAVQAVHGLGIVIGDLSLSNILLSEQGLRLIDFEAAFEDAVEPGTRLSTLGYRWPAAAAAADFRRRDWYAVGAVMLATMLPINVLLELHQPGYRTFLRAFSDDLGLHSAVAEVIGTFMDTEHAPPPCYPEQALRLIEDSPPPAGPHQLSRPRRDEVQATIDGAIDAILESADPSRRDRLFPGDPQLYLTNPLCLAWGATGVAYALRRSGRELPPHLTAWILSRRINPERYPPGLLVGSAGISCALWELGLEELARRTLAAAGAHPLLRESADLFSGMSGYGLACLRFHALTREEAWLDRAAEVGEWLLAHRQEEERGCCWPSRGEAMALGLGMGATGIALFLLRLSMATRDDRFRDLGMRALDYDLSYGIERPGGFRAFPPAVPAEEGEDQAAAVSPGWMAGSAGVASVAARYHLATGEPRFGAAFESIVPGVMLRYLARPGLFRGLAGLVLNLVDWHRLTGEDRFISAAHDAVRGLLLFRVPWRDGALVAFPGDGLQRLSMDLATGSAGVVLALQRYLEATE